MQFQMLGRNPKDDYNGLEWFADGMKDLFKDVTKVKVLDLGAGTGLSGEKVCYFIRNILSMCVCTPAVMGCSYYGFESSLSFVTG